MIMVGIRLLPGIHEWKEEEEEEETAGNFLEEGSPSQNCLQPDNAMPQLCNAAMRNVCCVPCCCIAVSPPSWEMELVQLVPWEIYRFLLCIRMTTTTRT